MSKCNEYTDMISAYADGELSDTQARMLETHLCGCTQCSALLRIYKDISFTAGDTVAEPPDELLSRVMSRLKPRKSAFTRYMTMYMPVAACLVVGFLVWRVFGSFNMSNQYDEASNIGGSSAGSDTYLAGGNSEEYRQAAADTDDSSSRSESNRPGGILDGLFFAEDATGEDPADDIYAEAAPGVVPDGIYNDSAFNSDYPFSPGRGSQALTDFDDYIDNAFAWITVTGQLSDYLLKSEPEQVKLPSGWDLLFIIPADDISSLDDELHKQSLRSSVLTAYNVIENAMCPDSNYAVVLYRQNTGND